MFVTFSVFGEAESPRCSLWLCDFGLVMCSEFGSRL